MQGVYPRKSALERFYNFVTYDDKSKCWNWTGSRDKDGYGNFSIKHKPIKSHRFSYSLFVDTLDDSLQIDHLCDNKQCCNPEHLEQVTPKENNTRAPRNYSYRNHCGKGHEYTEENTYINKHGWRCCRTCERIKHRNYRESPQYLAKILLAAE